MERKKKGKMFNYKVKYRKIKYPRLEFKTGKLLIILPYRTKPEPIIEKHKRWIEKKSAFIEECIKEAEGKKLIKRSDDKFKSMVQKYIEKISEELSVRVNKIRFRKMKTKWASCSSQKNLTINTLMKLLPKNLLEYIVFHELTHLIERKHSKKFWQIIESRFPNHDYYEKSLFGYWIKINEKL